MGGKRSTISTSEQRILSLQVQQSSQGLTVPVVYGRTRVSGNLIWYGDFAALQHTTTTRSGKGGGGVTQKDTTYTYEAAIMVALCEGPIKNVVSVWRDKEKHNGLSALGLTLASGTHHQATWGHLQTKHPAQALSYSDTAYLYGANYALTKSAQIHNHTFEIDGKLGYSDTIVDANPRDIVVDLLTNPNYGCGFPSERLGDTDVYSAYCRALGLFLSPAFTEQNEAQQNIAALLEQTNSAAVFSQGSLKIIPYGDSPASGNGAVYVPNLTPLYQLTDDDFIADGNDPIECERKTPADAYNQVQIEYLDRSNDYNIAVAEAKDQANIEQYGLRPKEAVKMHGICDKAVAQQVAQLLLQRSLYVRNEYTFKLGWKYILLEPMDLVTLTDTTLGLNNTPVRITEIEEDAEGTLTVRAEDFPFGIASTPTYPTQKSSGYAVNHNIAPENAFTPVIFEAPLQLTNGEPQIWLATAGGENWGGCEVWLSTDGSSYVRAGSLNMKSRYGSLTENLPTGAVYDQLNRAEVQLLAGELQSVSENDARDLLTACYVGNEFMAFANAELTGVGQYRLGNLVRGAWGSEVQSHAAGTPFVRMDDALFRYAFDPKWLGKTVWIKLVSFNLFGAALQALSDVPAYSYVIKGAPMGQVANLRLTSAWLWGKQCAIAWDKLDGADSYDVEVYAANSQTRLRLIEGIVDNQYTYTLQDMKADGGQVRDVVFKVRGRAVTGKTGKWAQVVARNPQLKALQGIELESGLKQLFFKCSPPDEEDFAGLMIWVSDEPACAAVAENQAYDGADTFVVINKCKNKPLEGGKTYYLRAAGYDSFDKNGLNISSSMAFTVYEVSAIAKELSESNLAGSLKARIDLLDGNGGNSVNARLAAQAQSQANQLRSETQRLNATIATAAQTAQNNLNVKATELTAQAATLGNRITAAENVNAQQAQAIQNITAAQGNAAAALEAEKVARANADRAETAARETLAAKLAAAESQIAAERMARTTAQQAETQAREVLTARLNIADTRHDNQPPTWYWQNHPKQTVKEFKSLQAMGLGQRGFGLLQTDVAWENASGGKIEQKITDSSGKVWRRLSDTAHTYANGVYTYTRDEWTAWAADETALGAQEKADAVRAIAEAAQRSANAAQADLTAERTARTTADQAQTQQIQAAQSRLNAAESNIGNLQRTTSDQNRALSEMQTTLTAKIDGLSVGGRNLLQNSARRHEGAQYSTRYELTEAPAVGDDVVVTVWGELGSDRTGIGAYNSHGFNEVVRLQKIADGLYRGMGKWKKPMRGGEEITPNDTHLNVYFYPRTATSSNIINKIKLERGNVGTDWSPAPEDNQAADEAVQAELTAYKSAQAAADAAQTAEIQAAKSQIGQAQAALEQMRSTKADKTEVLGLVRTTLESSWRSDVVAAENRAKAEAARLNTATDAKITALQQTVSRQNEATATRLETLSASINNVNVGGRNLLLKSATGRTALGTTTYAITPNFDLSAINDLVLSVDIDVANFVSNGGNLPRIGAEIQVFFDDAGTDFRWFGAWLRGNATPQTTKQRLVAKLKIPDGKRIAKLTYNKVQINSATFDRAEVKNVKLETGVVATDWTPAPEDGESQISQLSAAVQTAQTATTELNGKVQAMHIIKVDANGHIAGFGLSSEVLSGRPVSRAIFNADQFGIGATGKSTAFPFVVDTRSNTVGVNGALVVNGKAIVDKLNAGDINGNKIAANSITSNKLSVTSLSAISSNLGSVTAGSLNIGGGRFVVNNQGQVSINAANGNVGLKINNDFIAVYDEKGVLRVKLGKLS